MRLLKVNDIWLDEPLYCDDEFISQGVSSSGIRAIDGTEIVFLQSNKAKTLNFSHHDCAWNTKQTLNALINLADNADEEEINLMTSEGTKMVRFDYSSGSPVTGEPLWVGGDLFKIELKFKLI